ncbi:LysR substrate-binding domain-containing protein [Mesorhizobium sp. BAC0120]|uniref:LysR substrate-binding domain-containing protein n=1 Tax=Mesorhizobium sp. BAC0120 TaxID=3090670 RepID=UPI00298CCB87|nr:LysR substrate-binding domain-containing protein [Mesorhizobium sp. BAC0120]MDW6021129.1 LysR substrate-binding domain-containing protein [Mesorhizobium sp. BAC0120]
MKPRQIEAFRAVIEAGSVTAAAERLRISQPAVSKLIMELEHSTKLTLFARDKRRVIPTPEARLLFEEIDRVFHSMDRIERFADDLREKRAGHVRLGCLPSLGLRVVPDLVARLSLERPDVHLTVHVRTSAKIADWVLSQQIDLGISLLRMDHPSVKVEPLTRANAVCILPPGHPVAAKSTITPEDLTDVPFIGLGREDRAEQMVSRVFDHRGVPRRVQLETNLSAVACRLVSSGAGVSIVDPFTAAEFPSSDIVIRPFRPAIGFEMWLLYPSHRPRSRLIEEFVGELRETIAEKSSRFV